MTFTYATLLGIIFIVLSMRVIALRGNPLFKFLKFTTDTDASLERAIRGHANFAEYTPLFLILLFLAELHGVSSFVINLCGGLFTIGRLFHGYAFAFRSHHPVGRVAGTALTLNALTILIIFCLVKIFV